MRDALLDAQKLRSPERCVELRLTDQQDCEPAADGRKVEKPPQLRKHHGIEEMRIVDEQDGRTAGIRFDESLDRPHQVVFSCQIDIGFRRPARCGIQVVGDLLEQVVECQERIEDR